MSRRLINYVLLYVDIKMHTLNDKHLRGNFWKKKNANPLKVIALKKYFSLKNPVNLNGKSFNALHGLKTWNDIYF